MKNKDNITIAEIRAMYQAVIHSSIDSISNGTDETVSMYAYALQQKLDEIDSYELNSVLKSKYVNIHRTLKMIICKMVDLKITKTPVEIPKGWNNYELYFRISMGGVEEPCIIRNGYLLKALRDAGIEDLSELVQYEAVLIYNDANVNSHICAFVKFEKINN